MPYLNLEVTVIPVLLDNAGSWIFVRYEFLDAAVHHTAVSASGIIPIAPDRCHSTVGVHIHLDVVIMKLQIETVELAFRRLIEIHIVNPVVPILRCLKIAHDVIGNLPGTHLCTGKHPVLRIVEKELTAYFGPILISIYYLYLRHTVLDVNIHDTGPGIIGGNELLNAAGRSVGNIIPVVIVFLSVNYCLDQHSVLGEIQIHFLIDTVHSIAFDFYDIDNLDPASAQHIYIIDAPVRVLRCVESRPYCIRNHTLRNIGLGHLPLIACIEPCGVSDQLTVIRTEFRT